MEQRHITTPCVAQSKTETAANLVDNWPNMIGASPIPKAIEGELDLVPSGSFGRITCVKACQFARSSTGNRSRSGKSVDQLSCARGGW